MAQEFYDSFFLELLPGEEEEDKDLDLQSWRQHIGSRTKDALRTCSAFTLAWAAHTILESPPQHLACMVATNCSEDEASDLLSPSKILLVCLLVLEYLASSPSVVEENISSATAPPQHDVDSPFFPLLVSDALAVLQAMDKTIYAFSLFEQNGIVELIESLLPSMVEGPLYKEITALAEEHRTVLPDTVRGDLELSLRKWTTMYQDDTYIDPKVWAPSNEEELSYLLDQQDPLILPQDLLLAPLPSVEAPFCRPLPPPMLPLYSYESDEEPLPDDEETQMDPYLHAELIWMTPSNNLRAMLIPDETSSSPGSSTMMIRSEDLKKVQDIFQTKAFTQPLPPKDERSVLQVLGLLSADQSPSQSQQQQEEVSQKRSQLFQEVGLTPQTLPKLVEHNPLVAHECLLSILQSSSESIKNEYLSALVGMDITLHTMEVVNRLATHGMNAGTTKTTTKSQYYDDEPILHPEYVNLFISSCIASCENIPDRNSQNRLVRLICVFIQSLLRNKIVHVQVRIVAWWGCGR